MGFGAGIINEVSARGRLHCVELGDHVINNGAHLLLGKDSESANIAILKTKLLVVLPVMPDSVRVDVQ
jgi:hypothetical protein